MELLLLVFLAYVVPLGLTYLCALRLVQRTRLPHPALLALAFPITQGLLAFFVSNVLSVWLTVALLGLGARVTSEHERGRTKDESGELMPWFYSPLAFAGLAVWTAGSIAYARDEGNYASMTLIVAALPGLLVLLLDWTLRLTPLSRGTLLVIQTTLAVGVAALASLFLLA